MAGASLRGSAKAADKVNDVPSLPEVSAALASLVGLSLTDPNFEGSRGSRGYAAVDS